MTTETIPFKNAEAADAPDACCHVMSPHEQKLADDRAGRKGYREGRERIYSILDGVSGVTPKIDVERGKYFTESMKETEGEMLCLRWAKALKHIAENIDVYIDDHNLLVGRAGAKPGRYGILFPELDGNIYAAALKGLKERAESPFDYDEEDARVMTEEIAPYWEGKTFFEDLTKALPEDTYKLTYDKEDPMKSTYIVNETASFRSSIQWVHDYEKILKVGFKGVKEEAQAMLDELNPLSPTDNTEKRPFLEAIITVSDAIVLWAHRYGDKAREMAATTQDPVRKKELEEIADRCYRVPEFPATNFRDAVQSQWFTQMFSRIEQKTGTIISNGRMDQYFYPYYKADKEAGILTDEQAMELLECMWVAMAEFVDLYISPTGGAFNEGYAHWEAVTIGGQTPYGEDATNELTYLFLRSKQEFPLNYPDLAARIHSTAPERYLVEVAKTIKEGTGFPKLINDEEVVPLLLSKGAQFEEAYDYAVSGCAECRMPNRDTYTSSCAYVNFASAVEMVLYNGKTLHTGDEVLSIETGDPTTFKTFDEFLDAYYKQVDNLLKHAFIQQYHIIRLRAQHFASPLGSSMHKLCMKYNIDLHQPNIPEGIDLGYFELMGYGTVVDSLAAIKKLVFEDKVLTMQEVIDACKNNFEGYEVVRQYMLNAPKYGNNDEYADAIAKDVDKHAVEFTRAYTSELGVQLDLRLVPFTSHVPFGKVVGATPNGRFDSMPLSDGSSPTQGMDVNGPTAILLSNYHSKNYEYRNRAARLLNIKFSPNCLAGDDGTKKLVDFIRTWCDLKLWHVQFNVVNKETLIEAKKHPDDYRGLIVRVAGYSAYFCELSPDLQDDLIARTTQEAI